MSAPSMLASLFHVHPRQGEWTVALRATLSAVLPLVVLLSIDRLDWAMYAAFGAMASLYGRNQRLPRRLTMQLEAGLALIAAVVIGVAVGISPARAWVAIPVIAVFATVTAVIAHKRNWHPGGVFFQIFAAGGVGSGAHTVGDFVPAAIVSICAVALVLALTFAAGLLGHLGRTYVSKSPREWLGVTTNVRVLPGNGPEWPWHHYVIRYTLGVGLAGVIATAIGIGHPYWAMVAAAAPLAAPDASSRTIRGVQRVIGTLAGVLVTWAVLAFEPSPILLLVIVGLAQAGAELFVGRNYAIAMIFVTPLALCMIQLSNPIPVTQLIADRAIETVLGVAVGLAIALLTKEQSQPGDTE